MHPAEVFLSHSTHDREMAERIAHALRNHGIPSFFSPFNLIGAQQWQQEILARSNVAIGLSCCCRQTPLIRCG